jgi:membrane protease subunit HflK
MAWNQPGNNQGARPRRPASGLDALWRRWQQRLTGAGGSEPRDFTPFVMLALLLLALIWLATGFYQVDAAERGVLQRFGKYQSVTTTGSGMGWHWPWPIETMSKVNVSSVNSVDYQLRMLTSDVNLVSISCAIQFQYADPLKVLFRVRNPEATLRDVSESAIREIIGRNTLDAVLAGEPRRAITINTRDLIQKTLDSYNAGMRIISVNLTDVQVPEPVMAAQRDANKAIEDGERFSKEAQAYANDILPKARGAAQRALLDAESYKLQIIGKAEGDSARFSQLADAYAQSPEITRNRLYIDAIDTVLSRSRKVVLDTKPGNGSMIYLPLDKMMDSGARAATTTLPEVTATPGGAAGDTADARSRERGER